MLDGFDVRDIAAGEVLIRARIGGSGPPLLLLLLHGHPQTHVLWGRHGVIERCFDPLAEWRLVAAQVSGRALECGHYIAEEAPEALLAELRPFLAII
jgi:pimeloyl-ACP methyl ester carboxylesterase